MPLSAEIPVGMPSLFLFIGRTYLQKLLTHALECAEVETVTSREMTCAALLEQLEAVRVIHVRGTPMSGTVRQLWLDFSEPT